MSPQPAFSSYRRTIWPYAACELHGLAVREDPAGEPREKFWSLDTVNGYLLEIDPHNDSTCVLNPLDCNPFIGAMGLAITADRLWFTCDDTVYFCPLGGERWEPEFFARLPYGAQGLAIYGNTLYATCQKSGDIFVFDRHSGREITRFYVPGIGQENLTVRGEELWVSDSLEQTVYCLDRATGEVLFSVLTPFEHPCGLAFYGETLMVVYSGREPYIRDNPNLDPNYELNYRSRTFIHPLYVHFDPQEQYALSNGYRIEVSYVEEIAPLQRYEAEHLEWRIALPSDTSRQKVIAVTPIGYPFREVEQEGQRVAVFDFPQFRSDEHRVFGWRAILEVWSIKYQISPADCENLPELPPDLAVKYLVDDDELAMHTDIIQRAAEEAIGRETNFLRKVYSIRNYVYDRLSYGIKPHIDTPDVALKRGVGSCGEYLGVLLAIGRLNGIACRTVGRYKCPGQPLQQNIPLQPDYNHVWMEFYLPGKGWLPMESNPDDLFEGGPYPTRFFMGLAWYHTELGKGIPFERLLVNGEPVPKTTAALGDLAINHVRFTILEELDPAIHRAG